MPPSLTDVVHRGKGHLAPTLLRGHSGSMSFVSFLPNDQIISASDEDKTVRHWRLSDGHSKVVKELVVCTVATSPNGRWLAIGGRDGRVRLSDLETPSNVIKSEGSHAHAVKSLSFSPDSSQLVSGAHDGTILAWSSTRLEHVAGPLKGHTDAVWWVCYSPDGRKVASCDRQVIQIWDSTTWSMVGVALKEQAWSLAWSSDSLTLFAGCVDGTIKCYNSDTGVLYATHKGHGDVVFSIALSHNHKFIATASLDKTVRLWEANTFQQIGPTLAHDARVYSVSISPDDSHLVSGARDSSVRVWNLRNIAPALFNFFPLEPNRGPARSTSGLHIPWRKPVMDPDHEGLQIPDDDNRTPTETFEESPEKSECNSTKSKSSKKRSSTIMLLFNGKRERDSTIDCQRTSSPSTQGSSSRTDSPYTDKESSRSVSSPLSTHSPSPSGSKGQVSESENKSFIREIRSDPTHDLTGSIVPEGRNPVSGGSHGDIYRGTLNVNGRAMRVAIKVIKKYTAQGDDKSKQRRLRREIKLWLKLDHRNVIPLLGTTMDYGEFPAMVCPWIENGSLTDYLGHRYNDLTAQLKFCILNDVALGLQYLHSNSIVHGDISGSNILIYGSGRACIADFGLSVIVTDIEESSVALTYQVKGTLRWTAPELLELREPVNEGGDTPKIFPTTQSDIYSFAGIMLHVLSGKRPYHYLTRDEQVIVAISRGERPKRPTLAAVVTDEQWEFMMACWSFEATDRPCAADMVAFVHEELLDAVAASCEWTLGIPSETAGDDEED